MDLHGIPRILQCRLDVDRDKRLILDNKNGIDLEGLQNGRHLTRERLEENPVHRHHPFPPTLRRQQQLWSQSDQRFGKRADRLKKAAIVALARKALIALWKFVTYPTCKQRLNSGVAFLSLSPMI